jgi:ArsR family transcriptional regulator, arsenate/arsenite/antimonite-responsive transcriptional repressor
MRGLWQSHRLLSICFDGDFDGDVVGGLVAESEPVGPILMDACCAPLSATLDEDQAVELARLFAALSDPVRLRLLSMVASQGEVCSCDLQEPLGKAQPTVSHHTKALAEAGLIVGERRGKWMWWRAVPERFEALRQVLQLADA